MCIYITRIWGCTGLASINIRSALLPDNYDDDDKDRKVVRVGLSKAYRYMFRRVLKEGGWENTVDHTSSSDRPWAVLLTGVNGIRKTTNIYQD